MRSSGGYKVEGKGERGLIRSSKVFQKGGERCDVHNSREGGGGTKNKINPVSFVSHGAVRKFIVPP